MGFKRNKKLEKWNYLKIQWEIRDEKVIIYRISNETMFSIWTTCINILQNKDETKKHILYIALTTTQKNQIMG